MRCACLLVAALLLPPCIAWRQFRNWDDSAPCDAVLNPSWPFAYAKTAGVTGASARTDAAAWEVKGRTASSAQQMGHVCATRGTLAKCHRCETIPCSSSAQNGTCDFSLQGVPWAALPSNIPTVTDAPFAVGPAVRHRNDFGNADRVCVMLSSTCMTLPGAVATGACAVRCWGSSDTRAVPDANGWSNPTPSPLRQGSVDTYAGNGTRGLVDGVSTHARFNNPQGIAADAHGRLFVADTGNSVIRVVWANRSVSIWAGTGAAGLQDGVAPLSRFSSPVGIAVYDSCPASSACTTVVVVADTYNHRIRIIRDGIVFSLAGGGTCTNATQQACNGYADGLGTAARFDTPMGIAVDDSGNIFVADSRNAAIRFVDASGLVRTLVGRTEPSRETLPGCPAPCIAGVDGFVDANVTLAELYTPSAVALGPGTPYSLVVTDGARIRLISRFNRTVLADSVALGGPGFSRNASLADIQSLTFVYTLAGSLLGGATDWYGEIASFDAPRGTVTAADARIYVADSLRCRVRSISALARVAQKLTCADKGSAIQRPSGCSSYSSPVDAQDHVVSPVVGNVRYNFNATLSASGLTLDGQTIQLCLGSAPPDVGVQSNNATLGPRAGTGATTFMEEEDTAPGTSYLFICPAGCGGGTVIGTGLYSMDSSICAAAIHAGVIPAALGGVFSLTVQKGVSPLQSNATRASIGISLRASTANGVTSSSSATGAARTFVLAPVAEPTIQTIVHTVAGAPATSLDSACGSVDASPPTAARFSSPAAIALAPNASVSMVTPLFVADAHGHRIRRLTPPCSQVCENGGVCVAHDTCTCAAGWSGFDCTTAVCRTACTAGTLCTAPDTCTCYPGFSGAACSAAQCVQPCHNGGLCVAPDTCSCAPGWFGTNCTVPVCDQTCGNGGNCTGPSACSCPSQWTGADCRTPRCSQVCGNGGVCVAPDTCMCPPDWSGHDCSQPVCKQGMFRADPTPSSYGASSWRQPNWMQLDVCDYDGWCNRTNEFECLQLQLTRRPQVLAANRSANGLRRSASTCFDVELTTIAVTWYRYVTEFDNVTEYWRRAPPRPYGWGPTPASHPWSEPAATTPDRQIALVTYANVTQGVYVCANGGNCTAPNVCTCAPGWVGFDCRTPVCTQGYYYPFITDPRFPGAQGTYTVSGRTLTVWENPRTPNGKFAGYMHDHPNFHSILADMDAALNLPVAYVRVPGLGDNTREGWRREPWWSRVPLVAWQPGLFTTFYNRTCRGAPYKTVNLLTNVSGVPVTDTFPAFQPRSSYTDRAAQQRGWWIEPGGECIDEVLSGCFNGGVCESPNQCRCAAGWAGDDCTLPICSYSNSVVTNAPSIPATLLRASGTNVGAATGPPPPLPGDSLVQYYKCPHNGNCTRPDTCTCEKGWTGPACMTPLCGQECSRGGVCVAPDTCSCETWPSNFLDMRKVPVFRKPDGDAQDTGWTGYDCNTPICVQAEQFVLNDDTGQYPVTLAASTNDGQTFQAGCVGRTRFTPPRRNRTSGALCGRALWYEGVYNDTAANALGVSEASAGRLQRINHPNYLPVQVDGMVQRWTQGPAVYGEGIYACYNGGSCVAPNVCECAPGWTGFDCGAPVCAFRATSGATRSCMHDGICSGVDKCTCVTRPSRLDEINADLPLNASTGWTGPDCSIAICVQGYFDSTCSAVPPVATGVASAGVGCYRCSNGGNCTAPDTCTCAPGWAGYDCTIPVCTVTMTPMLIAQLGTMDSAKAAAMAVDPCGSKTPFLDNSTGTPTPRGFCTRPNVCSCTCRNRAFRDASGKLVATPYSSNTALPSGYIYGTMECLDGWEGMLNADGTFATCHLRIYVPTELELTLIRTAVSVGVVLFVLIVLLLFVRWRYTQWLKRRDERERAAKEAAARAAAEAALREAEERRHPGGRGDELLPTVPAAPVLSLPMPDGLQKRRGRRWNDAFIAR